MIGRAVQGAGGGGLIALTEVVVTDLVPLAERGKYLSILSAIWSVGTVAGPLIGAGFAQDVSWRWIFWVNLPVIAAGVAMVFFFLKQERIPGGALSKMRRFDFVGAFLFVVGSTSFLFGVSSGGVMYDWGSWQTLVSMLVGVAVMVVFGFWEVMFAGRFGTEPLINRGIFNNWTIISADIQAVLHGAILWALLYFLSTLPLPSPLYPLRTHTRLTRPVLYYQGVKLYSPITSAVAVLPETLTVAPAAMAVGIASAISGRYRWALWSGWAIATLGSGLLYLLDRHSTVPQWIFLNLPIGLGTGMVFPATALAIQAASQPRLNADAAAFYSFLRTFGQSIGVAVSGTIFQNAFRNELEDLPEYAPLAEELSREATMVVGLIKEMPDGAPRGALMDAYNEGLRIVWIALTALAGVSLLLSLTVKGYSLQQEHVSKQKLVAGEKSADEEAGEKK